MKSTIQIATFLGVLLCAANAAHGTPPPPEGQFPPALLDRLRVNPAAFTYQRALFAVTERALVARATLSSGHLQGLGDMMIQPSEAILRSLGGSPVAPPPTRVSGTRAVPVLTATFGNAAAPFNVKNLQQQLFDGPWPTGTMTEYYTEISRGALTVRGTVYSWQSLARPSSYYEGPDYVDDQGRTAYCNGVCPQGSRITEFVKDLVTRNAKIDWGQYDNDGPDGIPNSGDDDGYVDFVAFVHSGIGGECRGDNNRNIWSHRASLTGFGATEVETASRREGGGFIKIDDYVVMPALACDGKTMIQIGVFAHEFGHAFGLPDLYDTSGSSSGVGHWCLMASGSWGGNGKNPARPAHMSPWAKHFLGWIDVHEISIDQLNLMVSSVEGARRAYKVPISPNMYYLVNVINAAGFNQDLPGKGLQLWKVNETVVRAGLRSNRVNADPTNPGVELVPADGLYQLRKPGYRGGPNDIFPGGANARSVDATTRPSIIGRIALCNISDASDPMSVNVLTSRNRCAAPAGAPAFKAAAASPAETSPKPKPAGVSPLSVPIGTPIVVEGTLVNLGTNYFDRKSRRIVLVDDKGSQFDIAPGLVLESAKPAFGGPPALGQFLDRKVRIEGTVEKGLQPDTPMQIKADRIQAR